MGVVGWGGGGSNLGVPEMCCQVVTLLAQLEGDYLVHFELGILV